MNNSPTDSAPMLADVQASIGGGGVLKTRSGRLVWEMGSIRGCSELVDYIDEHSSGTPFEDSAHYDTYTRWKDAVKVFDRDEHLTPEGAKRVIRIRDELLDGNKHTITTDELLERVELFETDF